MRILGLDIEEKELKGALVTLVRGHPHVNFTFECPLEISDEGLETEKITVLYPEKQKNQIQSELQTDLISTSIGVQDVLVRPLELSVKKKKDIDAVLVFQTEPLLPYPAEEALIDRIILSHSKEGSRLSILAVKKDHLTKHLNFWHNLEIEPEIVTASPSALAAFAKLFCSDQLSYAIYIGFSKSFCILMDQKKLIAAQNIPEGIDSLIETLAEMWGISSKQAYLKIINPEFNLFQEENPSVKAAIEALRINISRTAYALGKQIKGKEIDHLFITGPGALMTWFVEYINRSLQKTPTQIHEGPISGLTPSQLHLFALPIGNALCALPIEKEQIDFRKNEFAYPHPWRRLKRPLVSYFILCIVLAIVLIFFGHAYVHYKEREIKHQYLELLSVMNKPYRQLENEFKAKSGTDQESETKAIALLNADEIKARLAYLEKEIQSTPQTYPLQPNIPLVSDLLAWLSTHPSFVGKQEEGLASPGLQIESLSYMLVKRPEPTKKQEKYQAKVELEFTSPTPKIAREFHDALIAPNEMVDPKGEIKWNSNKDRYRTSFYLKDKTIYTTQ